MISFCRVREVIERKSYKPLHQTMDQFQRPSNVIMWSTSLCSAVRRHTAAVAASSVAGIRTLRGRPALTPVGGVILPVSLNTLL
jgi:hypothetical protein